MFVDEDSEAATLYAASEKEIRANARLINAKATQRKSLGVGGAVLMIGTAVWLSCQGYSSVVEKKAIAQEQATELYLAALSHATINVKLADGGEVALKDGGQVRIDPESVVRVTGTVAADMPRPSPEQVRQEERPAAQAAAVTNFTRFYTVPFGAGAEVQTAWVYQSSTQQTPSEQHCDYLGPTHAGAYDVVILGRDGRINLPASAPAGVDLLKAASLCAWTGSAKPAPVAPSNTNLIHAKS